MRPQYLERAAKEDRSGEELVHFYTAFRVSKRIIDAAGCRGGHRERRILRRIQLGGRGQLTKIGVGTPSGLMYAGVPTLIPACVRLSPATPPSAFPMPKSVTMGTPS
jgi:hypothetical protein